MRPFWKSFSQTHHQIFLTFLNRRWPRMAFPNPMKPKGLNQGSVVPWVVPWINSAESSCLKCSIQILLLFRHTGGAVSNFGDNCMVHCIENLGRSCPKSLIPGNLGWRLRGSCSSSNTSEGSIRANCFPGHHLSQMWHLLALEPSP